MPAGTIALTNNSATVTGTGTSFTTELKVNDFLVSTVGGVAYTLGVKSIESNTSLTLMEKYTGPSASGQSWTPVPYGTMAAITAQLAAQVTYAIRGFNLDKANWQQIFTGTGTVTVTLPDGTSWQGPAWNGIATAITGKLDKTQNLNDLPDKSAARTSLGWVSGALPVALGGTGGATQDTARSGLGLGSAAIANTQTSLSDTTSGRVMRVGAFGLGASISAPTDYTGLTSVAPGLYQLNGSNWNNASGNYGGMVSFGDSANGAQLFIQNNGGNFMYRGQTNKSVYIVRSTQNTTVDGSGYIKQASPIARLSNDSSLMEASFYDGFTDGGNASVNEEAEGVKARRSGLGSYIVTGCVGLSVEGWQIEVPKDINGNRLCFVKSEITDAGNLSIKVFKPKLDIETGGIVAGEPIDIPDGRWIDLRLAMPEDSAYNLRMREQEKTPTSQVEDSGS